MRVPDSANLEAARLREIAVAADCDPRTVARLLRGEKVRGYLGDRIRRAMATPDAGPRVPAEGSGSARLRALAVAASCAPQTVARVLSGARVRGTVRKRIELALAEHGANP
jgi:hypothetical protein